MSKNTKDDEQKKRVIKIMDDYHSGDSFRVEHAKELMIKELEKFCYKLIYQYAGTIAKREEADLFQVCVCGIMMGMRTYDPLVAKPTTWFEKFIKHEIIIYRDNLIYRSSVHYATIANKITSAINRLEKKQIPVTTESISIESGETPDLVEKVMDIIKRSKDMQLETDTEFDQTIHDNNPLPVDVALDREAMDILMRALERFPVDEQEMFLKKNGLLDGVEDSYSVIAKELNRPINEVIETVTRITRSLSHNKDMLQYLGRKNSYRGTGSVELFPRADYEEEDGLY